MSEYQYQHELIPCGADPWKFHEKYVRDMAADAISLPIAFDPFYWHDLTLIPTCISNHKGGKVWNEIIYPFQTSTVQRLKSDNG